MSYNIMKTEGMSLLEGVELIQASYPNYNLKELKDSVTNEKYSVQMIEKSLQDSSYMKEILKMIIFDCLIGNSDRHHSNWAEIAKVYYDQENYMFIFEFSISPLYDNGSSLCSYINEEAIELILKDNMRFEALVNTKSKSAIGWENVRPINHFDLLKKIRENYFDKTKICVKTIKDNIDEINIVKILDEFSNDIISTNMKKLLRKYIIERKNRILKIYNMKDEG